MAVNIEIRMPMLKVMAKPLITLVENWIKIKQVRMVDRLPSRMESQARSRSVAGRCPFAWRAALRGLVSAGVIALALSASASAQERPAPPATPGRPAGDDAPLDPGEVGRLFDAYALMQAQDTLGLDEAQYERFVGRFKALLETRRRHAIARVRIVRELGQLSRAEPPDDEALRAKLKALDEEVERGRVEATQAQAGVDEVLTLVQRARFRLLEEQLERRRWELMSRARQQVRQRRGTMR
jgi:Spy/CpxP family protein refolding chaperone